MPFPAQAAKARIDLSRYELSLDGQRVKLERQPMELLILLAQRSGQLVTRDEIVDRLWGKNVFVDAERSINAAVRKIRRGLRDDTSSPTFLETVVGKGYRLIAAIALIGDVGVQTPALVVLPFEPLSANREDDYFADGITDELTTSLAQISGLRIISRTSAIQYRGTCKSVPQIAHELNVDAVVEGSILTWAGRVRISAQLIDARTDHHLWAQSFEAELRDVLTLQNEIARQIASHIQCRLAPDDEARLLKIRSVDPKCYENYLLGRSFWNRWTEEGIRKSIFYYEKALEISPDYALAHAALADSYNALGALAIAAMAPNEAIPKSKRAALRALELDDTLAEAHSALGAALLFYDWDWTGAERELKRAIKLNPNYGTARNWYSSYLLAMKRYDESLAECQRALELSPLGVETMVHLSWHYFLAHDFDQSAHSAAKALEMDSSRAEPHLMLGLAQVQLSKYDEAIKSLHCAVDLSGGRPIILSALGNAHGRAGQTLEARQLLHDLSAKFPCPHYEMAAIYASLSEYDEAFRHLQAAMAEHASPIVFLPNDPCMDPLRSDPRFGKLLAAIGLTS
jgi:TolB-like protein/Tfp pilus assembly protein PilF